MWALLALLATARVGHLAVFMVDVDATEFAMAPDVRPMDAEAMVKPFFPKHSCFSCYVVAEQLADEGVANIYDPGGYRDAEHETPAHREIGDHLKVDRYQYPPPFLLLPWALQGIGRSFFAARALFFFLNVALFGACLAALHRWIGGDAGRLQWVAWPVVLGTGATLTTLQIGNVHPLIIMISVLGMLAFARGRLALGGALLGFAIASKLFPGLLLVYLLAKREFRAAAWTVGFGLAYALLTGLVFGWAPWAAFFDYQLGRLASGEAFDFAFEHVRAITVNHSVMGIAYKLERLGVLAAPSPIAKASSWIYGLGLLAGAAFVGWRRRDRDPNDGGGEDKALSLQLWLALLVMAQFRSPFLPWGYGNFVALWLCASLAPWAGRSLLRWAALGVAWIGLGAALPLPWGPRGNEIDWIYTLTFWFLTAGIAVAVAVAAARAHGTSLEGDVPKSSADEGVSARESSLG